MAFTSRKTQIEEAIIQVNAQMTAITGATSGPLSSDQAAAYERLRVTHSHYIDLHVAEEEKEAAAAAQAAYDAIDSTAVWTKTYGAVVGVFSAYHGYSSTGATSHFGTNQSEQASHRFLTMAACGEAWTDEDLSSKLNFQYTQMETNWFTVDRPFWYLGEGYNEDDQSSNAYTYPRRPHSFVPLRNSTDADIVLNVVYEASSYSSNYSNMGFNTWTPDLTNTELATHSGDVAVTFQNVFQYSSNIARRASNQNITIPAGKSIILHYWSSGKYHSDVSNHYAMNYVHGLDISAIETIDGLECDKQIMANFAKNYKKVGSLFLPEPTE